MRAPRILGSLTLLAVLGASVAARGDDDALSDTARELFVKGVKAYEQQKWDQCRAALLAAFAIKRHSQIAGNLAECELKLGNDRDAAEHAWFFAHTLQTDASAERRAAGEGLLKEALKKVGALAITVDVSGTSVLVDGQAVGKAPLEAPVFVEPGAHVVEALRAGDPGARVTVNAGAGETREVALSLKKKEAPPPPQPLPVVEKRPLWPVLAAGSVAVVAVGVGVGLTVAANGKSQDARTLGAQVGGPSACFGSGATQGKCPALMNALTSQSTWSDGAFAAYLTGGIAAVGALGLGIWAALAPTPAPVHDRRAQTVVRVVPAIGARDAGIVVMGAW